MSHPLRAASGNDPRRHDYDHDCDRHVHAYENPDAQDRGYGNAQIKNLVHTDVNELLPVRENARRQHAPAGSVTLRSSLVTRRSQTAF